jgi:hypothetical protein
LLAVPEPHSQPNSPQVTLLSPLWAVLIIRCPLKSVDGNAQLTLVSNFTGPTQSGAAWSAVPRVALNMVTAALVAQSAEALRGLNYDKQNWQSIFLETEM